MAREPHFVVKYSSYLGTAIKLVLYILKQLFASVSVNSGGYLPRWSGSVNIHRYSPPLRRIIVNYCIAIPVFDCPERRIWGGILFQLVNSMSCKVLAWIPRKSGSANCTLCYFRFMICNSRPKVHVTPQICEKSNSNNCKAGKMVKCRFSKETIKGWKGFVTCKQGRNGPQKCWKMRRLWVVRKSKAVAQLKGFLCAKDRVIAF